jgi:hypothetical protein
VTGGPLPRERLPGGLEAWAAEPVVLAVGGDPDRARVAWAFAHGMTILELDGRFPPGVDLNAAWASGIAGLTTPRRPSGSETRMHSGTAGSP